MRRINMRYPKLPTEEELKEVAKKHKDEYYFCFRGQYWGFNKDEYDNYLDYKERLIEPLMTQKQLDTIKELCKIKEPIKPQDYYGFGIIKEKDRPLERTTFSLAENTIEIMSKLKDK